jgi:DNA ligase D-like protein (predicted 3'-phosphoesterase)
VTRRHDALRDYRGKRNLRRSGEPGGRRRSKRDAPPRFVIQHHRASTDHYDFRLDVGGVLKSWALPKGPSTDPRDKRMARPTEDHPLDYADFEGVIPEGEYGAGSIQVWDVGAYRNLGDTEMGEALRQGHVSIELDGTKLRGGYALTRIRQGRDETWLIVKRSDRHANKRLRATTRSAVSGRTLRQIEADAHD